MARPDPKEWCHADGSCTAIIDDDAGTRTVYNEPNTYSRDSWTRVSSLPSDLHQLRAAYETAAIQEFEGLQGDVASLDREKEIDQIFARTLLNDLTTEPVKDSVRRTAYIVLAELADADTVIDQGTASDALGRHGHAFGSTFQDEGSVTFILDSTSGEFLQEDFSIGGKLFDRWTYQNAGFVPDDLSRP